MRVLSFASLFSRTARAKSNAVIGIDTVETLEACMRELCEVAHGLRELTELSSRSRHAFFRRAASGSRGITAGCLDAARDYRDRSIALGTPAARYAAPPWSDLGL